MAIADGPLKLMMQLVELGLTRGINRVDHLAKLLVVDMTYYSSPSESMNSQTLQGKVAIVTGASRGLGYGFALELARRGAKVRFP
jgi:hypothetical protein